MQTAALSLGVCGDHTVSPVHHLSVIWMEGGQVIISLIILIMLNKASWCGGHLRHVKIEKWPILG